MGLVSIPVSASTITQHILTNTVPKKRWRVRGSVPFRERAQEVPSSPARLPLAMRSGRAPTLKIYIFEKEAVEIVLLCRIQKRVQDPGPTGVTAPNPEERYHRSPSTAFPQGNRHLAQSLHTYSVNVKNVRRKRRVKRA
jgi:hypothetical protein